MSRPESLQVVQVVLWNDKKKSSSNQSALTWLNKTHLFVQENNSFYKAEDPPLFTASVLCTLTTSLSKEKTKNYLYYGFSWMEDHIFQPE